MIGDGFLSSTTISPSVGGHPSLGVGICTDLNLVPARLARVLRTSADGASRCTTDA